MKEVPRRRCRSFDTGPALPVRGNSLLAEEKLCKHSNTQGEYYAPLRRTRSASHCIFTLMGLWCAGTSNANAFLPSPSATGRK
jgi:hypothetical protein